MQATTQTAPTGVDIERRELRASELRTNRAGEIRGYASIFYDGTAATEFKLGDWGIERIERGAFNGVLADDVRALFNHDENLILGRTTAQTLKLGVDQRGLWFRIEPGESQAHRDVAASIKRGDVSAASFGFTIADDGDKIDRDSTGRTVRTIRKIGTLFDVGPVVFPAYRNTQVELNSERGKAEKLRTTLLRRQILSIPL